MKNIKIGSLFAAFVILTASCTKDFLNYSPTTALDNDLALSSVENCEAAAVGLYAYLNSGSLVSRNLTVMGDIASDNVNSLRSSAGHLQNLENYLIATNTGETSSLWSGCYAVVSAATKLNKGVDALMGDVKLTDNDKKRLQSVKAQSYGIRAFAYSVLANYFCLPYLGGSNSSTRGVLILDKEPMNVNTTLANGTLEDLYTRILGDITDAKIAFESSGSDAPLNPSTAGKVQYFMNHAAVYALEARVHLSMWSYPKAIEAADKALNLRNGKIVENPTSYLEMWKSTDITTEDLFTITQTMSTQLSAGSINTYYSSYGGQVSSDAKKIFSRSDYRRVLYELVTGDACGCYKYPNKNNVNNIPVIRVPEMYLTLAEAYANEGNMDLAYTNLFFTAQRDTSIKSVSDLQTLVSNLDDAKYGATPDKKLISFIKDERRRELMCEGFRWVDLRRNGDVLTRPGTGGVSASSPFRLCFQNYKISEFAYPIPLSELQANPDCKQNGVWAAGPPTLPKEGENYGG